MASDYADALGYLYSLTNYEQKLATQPADQVFELGRVQRMLELMGQPDRRFRSVHVAGTKGKGSTSAMIASCLHSAGYRTGFFSSPHLHTFRERIQIDGEMISEADLVRHLARVRTLVEGLPGLTTFETTLGIAFDYFSTRGVEWAVLEVGLGGRLDATNVVQPEVAVITPISYDHMVVLGDTIEGIAAEKAAIIKRGTPAVTSPQRPEAMAVIQRLATEQEAPLTVVGREWSFVPLDGSWDGQPFSATGPGLAIRDLYIPLIGRHQLANATTAVAALQILRSRGVQIPETAIREGLRSVRWPARLEILSRDPLLVVDGAHNGESMERVVQALDDFFPGRRRVVVFAALADKDINRMFGALLSSVDAVVFTRTRHPRAADPLELARRAKELDIDSEPCVEMDVTSALQHALGLVDEKGLVIATGSLSTAAAAREAWVAMKGLLPLPSDPV